MGATEMDEASLY